MRKEVVIGLVLAALGLLGLAVLLLYLPESSSSRSPCKLTSQPPHFDLANLKNYTSPDHKARAYFAGYFEHKSRAHLNNSVTPLEVESIRQTRARVKWRHQAREANVLELATSCGSIKLAEVANPEQPDERLLVKLHVNLVNPSGDHSECTIDYHLFSIPMAKGFHYACHTRHTHLCRGLKPNNDQLHPVIGHLTIRAIEYELDGQPDVIGSNQRFSSQAQEGCPA